MNIFDKSQSIFMKAILLKFFLLIFLIIVLNFLFEIILIDFNISYQKEILFVLSTIVYLVVLILCLKYFKINIVFRQKMKLSSLFLSTFLGISIVFFNLIFIIPIVGIEDYIIISKSIPKIDFLFFGTVLITPIIEELFYRKLCCDLILKKHNVLTTVIFTSFIFTFAHILSTHSNLILVFIGGLILGWVYCKTRNILFTIIIHLTINLINFPVLIYMGSFLENKRVYNTSLYASSLLFLIVVIYFLITRLVKKSLSKI